MKKAINEKRILFTAIGRRVELIQSFRESSLLLGTNIKIYGADMSYTAPALSYCDYTRIVVSMKSDKYIDNLLSICEEELIDLLIPTIDTDLLLLSKNKDRFESIGTRVMVSDLDKIAICRDKRNTAKFFTECGLQTPVPVDDYEKYDGPFPAFLKPKDGSSSINAYRINDKEQLATYVHQVPDYIIQPFVEGKEYTIDVFCDWNGNLVTIVPRERIQVRSGEVLKTQIFMDEKMINEAKIICDSFKPCGPITIQLIRDKNDSDWFIEINPRFGGGAPLSMKAGARSSEYIIKMLYGIDNSNDYKISDGAEYSRFDQSVCVRQGKGTIKGVIFDLDDTLYSEKEYVKSGFKAVSDFLGGEYEGILWQFFESGKPAIDELLKQIHLEEKKEDVLNIYRNHYPSIHMYEGVKELIGELKKQNIKIGIITDGRIEGQRNKIKSLGLKVDDTIVTDELGGEQFRKPCDIAFRILSLRWKLHPSDIIYIGDNPIKDFQGPKQIGMRTLYFKNNEGLYPCDDSVNEEYVESIVQLRVKILEQI